MNSNSISLKCTQSMSHLIEQHVFRNRELLPKSERSAGLMDLGERLRETYKLRTRLVFVIFHSVEYQKNPPDYFLVRE